MHIENELTSSQYASTADAESFCDVANVKNPPPTTVFAAFSTSLLLATGTVTADDAMVKLVP